MNSRRFLEIYKSKSRSNTANTLQYCRQFSAISRNFVAKRKLDIFTQSRWFIQGLPTHLQNEMFIRYELDPDDDVNIDFDDLLKKAMRLLIVKKKLSNFVHVEKESQGVEDYVIKCECKSRISSNPSCFVMPPLIPAYHSPNFPSPLSVQIIGTDYRPDDKKIDYLTEMMKGLALSVWTLQNNTGSSPNENIRPRLPPTILVYTSQPSNSEPTLHSDWLEGITKCLYCWAPDHYLKRHY